MGRTSTPSGLGGANTTSASQIRVGRDGPGQPPWNAALVALSHDRGELPRFEQAINR